MAVSKIKNERITFQGFTTDSKSIAANGAVNWGIDCAKSGYIPIGIIFGDTSNNSAVVSKTSLYSNTVYVTARNVTNSAINTTVTVRVLYVPN